MLVLFLSNSRGVASSAFFRIGIFKLVIFLFLDSAIFFSTFIQIVGLFDLLRGNLHLQDYNLRIWGFFVMLYFEDNSMQVAVEAIRLCVDLTLGK